MRGRSRVRAGAYLTALLAVASGAVEVAAQASPAWTEMSDPIPRVGRPVYVGYADVDVRSGILTAEFEVGFIPDDPSADSVTVYLNEGLELSRVEGTRVTGYRTGALMEGWSTVTVGLRPADEPATPVRIRFAYQGQPILPSSGINRITPEWVELNLDGGWHPVFPSLSERIRGRYAVGLPRGWDIVSSGEVRWEQGRHVVRTTVEQTDLAFTAAPRLEQIRRGEFTAFHPPGLDEGGLQAMLGAAEACRAYLNERYGTRERLPGGRLVIPDRDGPGYSRKNYIVLNRPDEEVDIGTERFICHELAHFWSSRASASTVENWLNEAFAEYVAIRAVRERHGAAAFEEIVERWRDQVEGLGPVWTSTSRDRGSVRIEYRKAPLILHDLEAEVGRTAFERILARYMTEEIGTTREILAVVEEEAGTTARMHVEKALAASGDTDDRAR